MFQKANRAAKKLRMLVAGPSGAGKTYTALALASGMGKKIAVIDTEHGSSNVYADKFDFDVCSIDDYDIDTGYLAAMREAHRAGYDVLVIDSVTHAWQQLLTQVDQDGKKFQSWAKATPKHERLIQGILNVDAHVICTARTKIDYSLEGGRVSRHGTKVIQREGFDYEFDVVADMDEAHNLRFTKSRFSEFQDKSMNRPGPEVGERILAVVGGALLQAPKIEKAS